MTKRRVALTHGLSWHDWQALRQAVLERDHFQCVFYPVGCKNGKGTDGHGLGLAVDHVIDWKESHNNSMANLRTLCVYHHAMYGRRSTEDPFSMIDNLETIASLNSADSELEKPFGVLQG